MLSKKLNSIRPQLLTLDAVLCRSQVCRASERAAKAANETIKLAELDPEIDEEIKNGARYKKVKSFRPKIEHSIPAYLEMTATKLIEKSKTSSLVSDVKEMTKRIFHSQLPPEEKEVHVFAKEIESKFIAREKSNMKDFQELTEDEKLKIYIDRNKKIEQVVKKKVLSWKEYKWNEYQAILYLAARLAPNYMATRFVFNEIKHIDPTFKPKTLFDFGSGLGTTMHVANEMWPASLHEHVNVDASKEMIDLCDLLLKDGDDRNSTIFNNVFYKQFLPVGRNTNYDLVVSAFALKEQPNVNARIHVIENLWHKANDILVFIEHGNQAGTAAILEARSFILKMNGYDPVAIYNPNEVLDEHQLDESTKNPNVHIMAPCPHHYCCPRLTREYGVFCNFGVKFMPIPFGQHPLLLKEERLSYVVFRKRPKFYNYFPSWPRVVQEPKRSQKLVTLRLCTPQGKIEELNVSKGKHDKNTYDCARACKWGDCYPAKVKEMCKLDYKRTTKSKFYQDPVCESKPKQEPPADPETFSQ